MPLWNMIPHIAPAAESAGKLEPFNAGFKAEELAKLRGYSQLTGVPVRVLIRRAVERYVADCDALVCILAEGERQAPGTLASLDEGAAIAIALTLRGQL
jgi:hypothetical protein